MHLALTLDQILFRIFVNQWRVIGIVSLLLLASTEIGFCLGRRLYQKQDEARKGQISGIRGAMLGLLGLLARIHFRNGSRPL